MKKVLSLLIAFVGFAGAENAGYVKGISTIVGIDGKQYIRVEHSTVGGYFGAGGNQLWGTFYVRLSLENDLENALRYAELMKSLSNHSITLNPQSGYTSDQVVGGWVPVITNYLMVSP